MRRRILFTGILIIMVLAIMVLFGAAGFAGSAGVSVEVTIAPAVEVSGMEIVPTNTHVLRQIDESFITFVSP
ncbi:MAG: hypothetical protein JW738_08380 [Actinobacteria bacterium]|nr:hypothetical protein [Actinomycetota bacterium]